MQHKSWGRLLLLSKVMLLPMVVTIVLASCSKAAEKVVAPETEAVAEATSMVPVDPLLKAGSPGEAKDPTLAAVEPEAIKAETENNEIMDKVKETAENAGKKLIQIFNDMKKGGEVVLEATVKLGAKKETGTEEGDSRKQTGMKKEAEAGGAKTEETAKSYAQMAEIWEKIRVEKKTK